MSSSCAIHASPTLCPQVYKIVALSECATPTFSFDRVCVDLATIHFSTFALFYTAACALTYSSAMHALLFRRVVLRAVQSDSSYELLLNTMISFGLSMARFVYR